MLIFVGMSNESKSNDPLKPWAPPKWFDVLSQIRTMRARHDAPVDSMGCHVIADTSADPKVSWIQLLMFYIINTWILLRFLTYIFIL